MPAARPMTRGLWSLIQLVISLPAEAPEHCPYSRLVTLQKSLSAVLTYV